ncbi:MAG: hypothetical protein ACRC7F_03200 [Cetobacterium sp.]
MKNLEMAYNPFSFTGTLKIMADLSEPKITTTDKGDIVENYGYLTIRKGKGADGTPYISRNIKCSIETENGDTEYLDIGDYEKAGVARTSMFRTKEKGATMTRVDYALASDPKVVEQCADFMVIKFKAGELEFNTIDIGHLIDWMIANRTSLNGKRVVARGNAIVSEYDNNLQLKYQLKGCRDAFESEVDDLRVELNAVYTKNCIKQIPFTDLVNQDIKKVPVSLMFTNTNKDKQVFLIKSGDTVNLNVNMIDFNNPSMSDAYSYMTQLLNWRNVLDANTKSMTEVELEDFKYYKAKFIAHIKSNKKDEDLKEEELTMQEKFYLQMNTKTLDDIKRDRGVKKTTSKLIVIDAIPYDVEEIAITAEQLNGKPVAPASVSASQAFAQPQQQAPVTPSFAPQMPNFSLGLNK